MSYVYAFQLGCGSLRAQTWSYHSHTWWDGGKDKHLIHTAVEAKLRRITPSETNQDQTERRLRKNKVLQKSACKAFYFGGLPISKHKVI